LGYVIIYLWKFRSEPPALPNALAKFATFLSATCLHDYTAIVQTSSKGNMNQLNSVSSPTPAIINSLNNAINKINFTNAVGVI